MSGAWRWLREHAVNIVGALVVVYLLIPIAVIFLFSFNNPQGRYNFTWVGFTLDHWAHAFSRPELNEALLTSLKLALLATVISTDRRDDDGAGAGPPPVLRPPRRELPDRDPDGDPRGRDGRRAALVLPHPRHPVARLRDPADRPRDVLHQLRRRRRPLAADRLRPPARGGGPGPRRQRVHDLPPGHAAADHARHLRRRRCSPSRSRSTTS